MQTVQAAARWKDMGSVTMNVPLDGTWRPALPAQVINNKRTYSWFSTAWINELNKLLTDLFKSVIWKWCPWSRRHVKFIIALTLWLSASLQILPSCNRTFKIYYIPVELNMHCPCCGQAIQVQWKFTENVSSWENSSAVHSNSSVAYSTRRPTPSKEALLPVADVSSSDTVIWWR